MKNRFLYFGLLTLICVLGVYVACPLIFHNLKYPNLISYFNSDEGFLVDLVWSYFSGEVRPGSLGDVDYGLMMVYISDLAYFFSELIDFTPSVFVLILRWIHIVSWVGCVFALWKLIESHFSRNKIFFLVILLFSVNPSFPYYTVSSKPDYTALLFVILSLNFTLKILDTFSKKYLFLSLSCAAIALLIKFVGIFMLPAIVIAVWLGKKKGDTSVGFHKLNHLWVYPALVFNLFILSPIMGIFFYIRRSSGTTYFEEFGLLGSFTQLKIIPLWYLLAFIFLFIAGCFYHLEKNERKGGAQSSVVLDFVSTAVWISFFFVGLCILFGFKWILMPQHFITTYGQNIFMDFSGGYSLRDAVSLGVFFKQSLSAITERLLSVGHILLLFLFYLAGEFYLFRVSKTIIKDAFFFKKMVLIIFLVPFSILLITPGRFTLHHMLPFLVVLYILIIEGGLIWRKILLQKYTVFSTVFYYVFISIIYGWIFTNGVHIFKWHNTVTQRKHDIAFDVKEWIVKNIPSDAHIITDHPTRVYVPETLEKWTIVNMGSFGFEQTLKEVILSFNPAYIYYNLRSDQGAPVPLLDEIEGLRDRFVLLAKFNSATRAYQRYPGDVYVVYKVRGK